jgi:hypothetical protein
MWEIQMLKVFKKKINQQIIQTKLSGSSDIYFYIFCINHDPHNLIISTAMVHPRLRIDLLLWDTPTWIAVRIS